MTDQARQNRPWILKVALDVPVDEIFDYRIPEASDADIGRLVVVPFGRRTQIGVVMAVSDTSSIGPERLREPIRFVSHVPRLPPETLSLLRFCSRYYHHPIGQTILGCLPTALRRTSGRAVRARQAYRISAAGRDYDIASIPARARTRRALLAALQGGRTLAADALAEFGATAQRILRELVAAGWAESFVETVAPAGRDSARPAKPGAGPVLTPAQQAALAAFRDTARGYACHLLHGVTGSGKTEIYLQVIADAIAAGGQALLLVPEINLTPQLEARVAERFGPGAVVALHSGLAEGERLARWLRAVNGEANVVLGTRLAVFTPLPRPGVIVVDEEHDASFKQQEGLRYHARDVAVYRARALGIPIVLGSATPSLESWRHATTGRYRLLSLPSRPTGPQPQLSLVRAEPDAQPDALSPAMAEAIESALARREQALLFLNRRGFAPTLYCHACGWVAACGRCTARLTFHLAARRLRCHYCGHDERVPALCPSCGNQELLPMGQGTQRIETTLAARFPGARIARVDRDSTRRRGAFDALRERIHDHDVDLLVGTQMLAKGHDFPRVTFVGILGADAVLFAPDFRAEERLFALLLQVAGRAGRADLPGRVLIQTSLPDHPFYQALLAQDYRSFADQQLATREATGFPPFSFQALLRAEAPDEAAVFDFLGAAAARARSPGHPVEVYDPTPAWIARVAGKWRGQLLLQSSSRQALQGLLDAWLPALSSNRVRWSIDVDPQEL